MLIVGSRLRYKVEAAIKVMQFEIGSHLACRSQKPSEILSEIRGGSQGFRVR